jgi:hypothetical protein
MSTLSGVFTLADGLAHQEKLLKDPDFNSNFSQFLDCTHLTKVELRPEDVRRLAQRSIFSSDSHRAILVASDLTFGFARMFMMFRETQGEKGIRVFHSRDEALYWVLPENTAG